MNLTIYIFRFFDWIYLLDQSKREYRRKEIVEDRIFLFYSISIRLLFLYFTILSLSLKMKNMKNKMTERKLFFNFSLLRLELMFNID